MPLEHPVQRILQLSYLALLRAEISGRCLAAQLDQSLAAWAHLQHASALVMDAVLQSVSSVIDVSLALKQVVIGVDSC